MRYIGFRAVLFVCFRGPTIDKPQLVTQVTHAAKTIQAGISITLGSVSEGSVETPFPGKTGIANPPPRPE